MAKPRRRARRPSWTVTLALAVLALAAGWTAWWFTARTLAEEMLARFERDRVALDCAERRWGGYPFRIEFTCHAPALATPAGRIAADRLRLLAQAWDLDLVVGAVFGPLTAGAARIDMAPLRLSATLERGRVVGAALLAEDVRVVLPSGADLAAARISLHARRGPDDSAEIEGEAGPLAAAGGRPATLAVSGRLAAGPTGTLATRADDLDAMIDLAARLVGADDRVRDGARPLLHLLSQGSPDGAIALAFDDGEVLWGPFRLGRLPGL